MNRRQLARRAAAMQALSHGLNIALMALLPPLAIIAIIQAAQP